MPAPDFICPGMQKAGTGWLYDQLTAHPDFAMTSWKELHFFDGAAVSPALLKRRDQFQGRLAAGDPATDIERAFFAAVTKAETRWGDIDLYPAFFEGAGGRLTGDITPGYSTLQTRKVEALAAACPKTRIALLVREPASRLMSAIHMEVRRGKLTVEQISTPEGLEAFMDKPSVARRSSPSETFERWRNAFEACQFFIMDDLVADPVSFRARVIGYLGGDPSIDVGPGADFNAKQGDAKIELADWQRRQIVDRFARERERCAELFGGAAESWPDRTFQ